MQVHAAFGGACASRRVEPESGIVLTGGFGFELRRGSFHQFIEVTIVWVRFSDDHNLSQISEPFPRYGLELRK